MTISMRLKPMMGVAALFASAGSLLLAGSALGVERALEACEAGDTDGFFGQDVAIDGNTAVVASRYHDFDGIDEHGLVCVFERSGDSWVPSATLLPPTPQASSFFGDSVAIEGNTIAVGQSSGAGAVYVFERSGNSWTQTGKLTAADGEVGDFLGTSVAIDGDTIVAGAPRWDRVFIIIDGPPVVIPNVGAVYTFARTGAPERVSTARLIALDAAADDELGHAVDIDGDTIVAGAQWDDGAAMDQGALYTFERTGGNRFSTAKLTADDGKAEDHLGRSVAIDGPTIVAGAPDAIRNGNVNEGAVYTFARSGADRTQTATLSATNPENQGFSDLHLGEGVDIKGDTIVAAAVEGFGVYKFASTGPATRTETERLALPEGSWSIAFDGTSIIAGDRWGGSDDLGRATIFFPTSDLDGDGVTGIFETCPNDPGPASNGGCPLVGIPDIPPDVLVPETSLIEDIKKKLFKPKVKFKFSSSEEGSTFECKLDKKPYKACTSPKVVRGLDLGRHVFWIRAIDAAGNVEDTPLKSRFKVVKD